MGATGMIGQGVVRECLADDGIDAVLSIGRSPAGVDHPKFTEILHPNLIDELQDPASIEAEIAGTDAVFFCLGVPSARMSEADYAYIVRPGFVQPRNGATS